MQKNNEIMKHDKKGNYDLDGASSDGKDVYLAGDETSIEEESKTPQKWIVKKT